VHEVAEDGDIDLSRFEATAEAKPKRTSKRLPPADFRFQRLPAFWIYHLARAQCMATLKLANLLLVLDWEARGRPIALGNGRLDDAGVSHDAKLRALAELERLGLVRVQHRPFKAPIVTLIKMHRTAS
jgi:hypothetical protein